MFIRELEVKSNSINASQINALPSSNGRLQKIDRTINVHETGYVLYARYLCQAKRARDDMVSCMQGSVVRSNVDIRCIPLITELSTIVLHDIFANQKKCAALYKLLKAE